MARLKSSEMTEAGRRGRNSKSRGHAAERALAKTLADKFGMSVKRVARSGALKAQAEQMAGSADQYRGDLILTCGKQNFRIEVKTRTSLPKYISESIDQNDNIVSLGGFCWLLSIENFVSMWRFGEEFSGGKTDKDKLKCEVLRKWFSQDSSDIVAMRETGKRTWYFAVKDSVIKKIANWRKSI
jgi:hypothetical protein